MVLLASGWIVASGIVVAGSGLPAQAAILAGTESTSSSEASSSSVSSAQVLLGANRTTGVSSAGSQVHHAPRGRPRPVEPEASSATTDEIAVPALEQGTTQDQLTAGQTSGWWVAWMLLVVPGGTLLAWWVGRPRGAAPPSHGPLYS